MPRTKLNLAWIKKIDPIHELIEKSHISEKRLTRYLKQVNRIFPLFIRNKKNALTNKYSTFSEYEKVVMVFFSLNPNDKAYFLEEWVEAQLEAKKKTHPEGDFISFENTYRNIIWGFQGFLGKLGKEYKANPELIESQTPNSNIDLQTSKDDVLKLYDVLPVKYQLILKIIMFTGLNPADVVLLTLKDFKKYNASGFYYIHKYRQKTKSKKVRFINLFHQTFYEEVQTYTQSLPGYSLNDPIFPIQPKTVTDEFRFYLEKYQLNPKTIPQYIRQLNITLLEETLPSKLLLLWSQHKAGLMDTHYLKTTLPKLVQYYPMICEKVLLKSSFQYSKENNIKGSVAHLKQTIASQQTKIQELESKVDQILTHLLKDKS